MAHRTRLPRTAILAPLALAASLSLSACQVEGARYPAPAAQVVVAEPQRGGPPPHAPAHGYRRKQQTAHGELELRFDSSLGVYVVVGLPDLYFYADHYFRLGTSGWEISVRHDSGFVLAAQSQVPPGLIKAKGKQAKGKKSHPVPAKRRD